MDIPVCDHTSVGILVFREGKLLLIDRKRPPYGFAAPAGHVDDHGSYEQAAKDELSEEVGLTATSLTLLAEGRKENACRRPDGSWHYWKIYQVDARGEVHASAEETNSYRWCARENMADLLAGKGEIKLEPVWQDWFTELGILDRFPLV